MDTFPPQVNNSKEKYDFYDQICLLFSLNIHILNISVYISVFLINKKTKYKNNKTR